MRALLLRGQRVRWMGIVLRTTLLVLRVPRSRSRCCGAINPRQWVERDGGGAARTTAVESEGGDCGLARRDGDGATGRVTTRGGGERESVSSSRAQRREGRRETEMMATAAAAATTTAQGSGLMPLPSDAEVVAAMAPFVGAFPSPDLRECAFA